MANGGGPQFQLRLSEDMEGGVYANFLTVWHTAYEFTLDFAATLPAQATQDENGNPVTVVPARVTARVKVPPSLVFNLLRAINDNMTQYEAAFGPIGRPDDPDPLYPPDLGEPPQDGQPGEQGEPE